MKKSVKLFAFWSFVLLFAYTPLKAQEQLPIIPLEDHIPWRKHEVHQDIKYAYFKDVHNILGPMVGHWSAEKGNYLYDFWITKQEYVEIPQGRHDNLIIQYEVYEKGKILFSTLPITLQKRPRIPKGFRYYPDRKEYSVFYFGGKGQEGLWWLSPGAKPQTLKLVYRDDAYLHGFDPKTPQLFPMFPDYLVLTRINPNPAIAERLLSMDNISALGVEKVKKLIQISRMISKKSRTFTIGDLTTEVKFLSAKGRPVLNKEEVERHNYYSIRFTADKEITPISIQFYNHPTIVYESVVPIYLQALCHSLLIEKIKNLNNDSSVSFLKSPSSQDFGLVLDYYAQHTKQAPSALADQYVREMGDVIAFFGDDLDDVAPILWWGIRNSASFSELPLMEQARIDDILSTLGYIIRDNIRRPMDPNLDTQELK